MVALGYSKNLENNCFYTCGDLDISYIINRKNYVRSLCQCKSSFREIILMVIIVYK
jgi:hypothetical protein